VAEGLTTPADLRQGAPIKRRTAIPIALAAFAVGCGSDETTPETYGKPAHAQIEADSDQDRQLGLDLQDYMIRNCLPPGTVEKITQERPDELFPPAYRRIYRGGEALCASIGTIEVEDSRVTIRSGLDDAQGGVGEAFCVLMRGSDVADFTPGHELQDKSGGTIEVCPAEDRP
jgi:hypothetical protein